jgi:hypothetical protein
MVQVQSPKPPDRPALQFRFTKEDRRRREDEFKDPNALGSGRAGSRQALEGWRQPQSTPIVSPWFQGRFNIVSRSFQGSFKILHFPSTPSPVGPIAGRRPPAAAPRGGSPELAGLQYRDHKRVQGYSYWTRFERGLFNPPTTKAWRGPP